MCLNLIKFRILQLYYITEIKNYITLRCYTTGISKKKRYVYLKLIIRMSLYMAISNRLQILECNHTSISYSSVLQKKTGRVLCNTYAICVYMCWKSSFFTYNMIMPLHRRAVTPVHILYNMIMPLHRRAVTPVCIDV